MTIRKLDLQTTNQIAAGEVVENPASVVKELVENALDAGARRISLSLREGGLEEITVTDNGSGLRQAELRLALERHATSKITRLEDLDSISSLGFRGEALPSIASVSQMSITTRHDSETVGSRLCLEGGKETEFLEMGFPRGTRVTVQNLFFNTPPRKKFLKSISAETARTLKILQGLALSRPDVAFSLQKDGRNVLQTPGDGRLYNTIVSIFGSEMARQLLPLPEEQDSAGLYRLKGYISHPGFTKKNRSEQLFFVNHRYVKSALLREALAHAFSSFVTSKRYPIAFLYLSLPPAETDVNVHPTKTEIRFHREKELGTFLRQALREGFATRTPHETTYRDRVPPDSVECRERKIFDSGCIQERQLHFDEPQPARAAPPAQDILLRDGFAAAERPVPGSDMGAQGLAYDRIIGQLFNTYILIQQADKLLIIDQHAAHERIIWERMQQSASRELPRQNIIPQAVELSPALAEQVAASLEVLAELGLEIEQFGNHTFIIRTVPVFLKEKVSGELLRDMLEALPLEAKSDFQALQKAILLQVSCKGSVRARQRLSREEMVVLLEELQACTHPFYCPHGRPVLYRLAEKDLAKHFLRQA